MRIFMCLVAAACLVVVSIASAEVKAKSKMQFKIATLLPDNTDHVKKLRAAADEIKERTEGRVLFKYYLGGIQGGDDKVLYKMKIGQLHGSMFTPIALQKPYPDINIYGLPFIFESEDEVDYVRKFMDAKFQRGLEEAGFVNFGFAGGGFTIILSNEPVRSYRDLKGKKVWVPEGDILTYKAMEALDLTLVPLEIVNVRTGLQTGLINVVATTPAGALIFQWHTKVKYVTQMPILFTMYLMVIDAKAFNKINAVDQAIVREVMSHLYANLDATERKDAPGAMQALINSGIESVQPLPGEFEKLQKEMVIANRGMANLGMFSSELLEEMLSHVQNFRRAQASHDRMICVQAGNKEDAGEQVSATTKVEDWQSSDVDSCDFSTSETELDEQASMSKK
jgi:TRAP-type C4-dicarboxylate transport system substrate-binding protein